MKKMILVGILAVAGGLAVLFFLHTSEPSVPSLPPVPAAPPAPPPSAESGPAGAAPGASSLLLSAAKAPPAAAPEDVGLPDSLLALFKAVRPLWPMPDRDSVRGTCMANPRAAAEQLGLKEPEAPSVGGQVSAMLCKRENTDCDALTGGALMKQSSGDCQNPPCDQPVFLSASESMGANTQDCREWTSHLLFEDSALEGHPDASFCRDMLARLNLQLSDPETDSLCKLLADDINTGGYSFCRELSSKPRGGQKFSLQECVKPLESYVKGAQGCPKGSTGKSLKFNRPSCGLQARVREALLSKDASKCGGNPLCFAFLSPDGCEEERFVDMSNPAWPAICDAAVSTALQNWTKAFDASYPATHDGLMAHQKDLSDVPQASREHTLARIKAALADLEKAKEAVDKVRHSSITSPGEAPPSESKIPHKGRKSHS